MRYARYTLSIGLAALCVSAASIKAAEAPKMKMDTAVQKDTKNMMEQNKEQMESMKKKKMHESEEMKKEMHQKKMEKTEAMKKEAGKGSEKGQAMREEHSKKWWKFWGEKPATE